MNKGALLGVLLAGVTLVLIVIGTVSPVRAALTYAGERGFSGTPSTPEAAVRILGDEIRAQDWGNAYAGLANRAQFTEADFMHDVTGYYPSLRTYSRVDQVEVRPLHASEDDADVQLALDWATVTGVATDTRILHVTRDGDQWAVRWPINKEPTVPPQVIPVNYLRWDVIFRGSGDDWGVQNVDAPSVRIVDMHPIQRAEGVVVLGELLNEDVVPACVSVTATLQAKDQTPIATEGAFDKISHLLLPKQVTPFLIEFPDASLSDVGSIRMTPFSTLVPASADPVIEIDGEKLNPAPAASLTGQLINQSGQIVNVVHVLGTLYDKTGQLVWVIDEYPDRALLPQTPVPFEIPIPEDLARKVSSERTVVASFSFGAS